MMFLINVNAAYDLMRWCPLCSFVELMAVKLVIFWYRHMDLCGNHIVVDLKNYSLNVGLAFTLAR